MTPAEVVQKFCDLWATADLDILVDWFTDDAVYQNAPPLPAAEGKEAIREVIAGMLVHIQTADIKIHNVASNGNIVVNERVDVIHRTDGGADVHLPVMGVFEIVGDKIYKWRDYFNPLVLESVFGA